MGGAEVWQGFAAALVPVLILYRQELLERRADRQRQVILDAAKAAEATAALAAERRAEPRYTGPNNR